jgi:ParB family chromosome partitioning protein
MVDRKLGRGLDFFLSRADKAEPRREGNEVVELELGALRPNPFQPRSEFDDAALGELAESIRTNGVIQPIVVRRSASGYEIVAGERRWRAARLAGLPRIPAVVRDVPDEAAAVFALVENVQRADLNPLDKARAFRRLAEATGSRPDEVARKLGLDRSTVANFVRLLDLAEPVQALVSRGTLSMGHARALLGLSPVDQEELANAAVRDRLSVRDIEARAQALKSPASPKKPVATSSKKARPIWLSEIEETLAEALGVPVQVRYGRKRARIVIECTGRTEFERVYEQLKATERPR